MAVLTLYGSSIADGTLTTACDMALNTTGGTETSKQTVLTGSNVYGEIWSQGNAGLATVTAIPANPTGHGWVFKPGPGTFANANWSAVFTLAHVASSTSDVTIRFSKLSGGTYTVMGTINIATNTGAKTTYTFTGTSMPSTTFGVNDLVHVELWYHDANSNAGGDNPTIYISNSATQGVANDLVVTTSSFTASGVALTATCAGVGTLTGTLTLPNTVVLGATLAGAGTLAGVLTATPVNTCLAVISEQLVFVIAGSLNFGASIGKNSTCSFMAQSDTLTHFQQDQQVQVYDQSGVRVFSGYVTTPKEWKPGFQPTLEHTITCTNQHRLAEKRLVAASYVGRSPGYMANDIYTNILAAEGVTIGLIYDATAATDLFPSTSLFPSTTLYPTESVGTVPETIFGYCTVAQALDALVTSASASGVPYFWMIDQNKAFWFAPYTAVVNTTLIDGTQIDQKRHPVTVTHSNPAYRNTQYLLGGVVQTVQQTNIRIGDGNTTAFTMDFELASAPTVSTNLAGAGYVSKRAGIQGLDTGRDWYWQKGSKFITQDTSGTKLRGPSAPIDLLQVIYIGQYPTVIVDSNQAQVAYSAQLAGDTGIVEEAEMDTTISSMASGLAKTSTLLTRYAAQGTILEFMTKQTGFAPGQLVTVNLPDHQLNMVQMLIEDVSGSDSLDGFNIWYTIKAVLGPYDVSWVDFFSTLLTSQTPVNSINVGVSSSVIIVASGSVSLSPTVTGSATVVAAPVPDTTLFPSLTLFPG